MSKQQTGDGVPPAHVEGEIDSNKRNEVEKNIQSDGPTADTSDEQSLTHRDIAMTAAVVACVGAGMLISAWRSIKSQEISRQENDGNVTVAHIQGEIESATKEIKGEIASMGQEIKGEIEAMGSTAQIRHRVSSAYTGISVAAAVAIFGTGMLVLTWEHAPATLIANGATIALVGLGFLMAFCLLGSRLQKRLPKATEQHRN